jgi:gag-polypeptide of LTR copia-type
MKDKSDLYVLY